MYYLYSINVLFTSCVPTTKTKTTVQHLRQAGLAMWVAPSYYSISLFSYSQLSDETFYFNSVVVRTKCHKTEE